MKRDKLSPEERQRYDEVRGVIGKVKECKRCHELKPYSAFGVLFNSYGYQSYCRACVKAYNEERKTKAETQLQQTLPIVYDLPSYVTQIRPGTRMELTTSYEVEYIETFRGKDATRHILHVKGENGKRKIFKDEEILKLKKCE